MKKRDMSRQSFLGNNSEAVLHSSKVAIIGLGGGGSHIFQQLAHIGVGDFELFDPDYFEDSNLNRNVGSRFSDINKHLLKTSIASRLIRSVNPNARVRIHSCDWRHSAEFIRDCDVVFGCVDSFAGRNEIEILCRRYLIPYIDVGMDVFELEGGYGISGQIVLSMPGEPCMRCLGFLRNDLIAREAARYGAAGGRPQVIWPNGVLTSTAVGMFIELISPWNKGLKIPAYLEYDGNSHMVFPSKLMENMNGDPCRHFSDVNDLGDPFF